MTGFADPNLIAAYAAPILDLYHKYAKRNTSMRLLDNSSFLLAEIIEELKEVEISRKQLTVVETMIKVVSIMKKITIYCLTLPYQAHLLTMGTLRDFFKENPQ